MIELNYTGMCKDCPHAKLKIEELTMSRDVVCVHQNACERIIGKLNTNTNWRYPDKQMPHDLQDVLIAAKIGIADPQIYVGYYNVVIEGKWTLYDIEDKIDTSKIIAWMPLPAMPKMED